MCEEMHWNLVRRYFPNGTNANLWCGKQLICHTIELPWHENRKNISCIPEGTYPLIQHNSRKFGKVLMIQEVECRNNILIHPANDAQLELKGCIAPVLVHTGEGIGLYSQMALQQLLKIAQLSFGREQKLFLKITSNE